MPTRAQIENALIKADAAGNTEDAKMLANALKSQLAIPAEVPRETQDFSVLETIKNIPSSAAQVASDIVQPIISPIETGKAVGSLALGGLDKLAKQLVSALPEEVVRSGNKLNNYLADLGIPLPRLPEDGDVTNIPQTKAQTIDQVGKFIKDRYGSLDKFSQTVMKDPVGVLADASLILTGGGTAAARLPGVAGKVGKAVQTAGKVVEPITLIKEATKIAAAKVIPKAAPTELFESSAKFSTTFPKEKRKALAETALEHGILPTSKGVDKLNKLIKESESVLNKLLENATKLGAKIPRKAVFTHLKKVRQELGGIRLEGGKDLNLINKMAKEFTEHLKTLKKSNLTPTELQSFKINLYKDIKFDAKQLRSSSSKDVIRKAIGRAAKEAIERVADVKSLNKELGRLLKLKEPISRSAGRIENRDIVSIGAPIKIGVGTAAGGGPGAAVGVVLSVLENPKIKARIALTLKKIQDAGDIRKINPKLRSVLINLGLLQAGRAKDLPPDLPPRDEK